MMLRPTLIAVIGLSLAGPASAKPAETELDQIRTEMVNYADLDLSQPAGVRALDTRIRAAANRVCDDAESRSLAVQGAERHCVNLALQRARSDEALAISRFGNEHYASRGDIRIAGR